jgi:peptidoglycan/xylan/chitin deacetylase (PgdA/CDA1 family)
MSINKSFYKWLTRQNHNYAVMGLATFTFPRMLVRSIYQGNRGRGLWGNKKGCVTLSFDCDYPDDAVAIPGVVDMLKDYSLKASFAAVGYWVERYTKEHEAIVRGGHEVMNHTYSHPDNEILNPGRRFRDIPTAEKAEELTRCHEICERLLGVTPTGFRVPHFKNLFTPDIYSILRDNGYRYSSSTWLTNTTSHGMPFVADHGVVEFPLSSSPIYPFTVFDTWHVMNSPSWAYRFKRRGPDVYLQLFKELLDIARDTGSYMNIYMDPLDVPKIPGFREMLELTAKSDLHVVTYQDYLDQGLPVLDLEADARKTA